MVNVLIPTLETTDALKVVEEDWENDRQGAERLDYARIYSAVFELVDLWTPGLSVEEYVSFVEALGHAVRALHRVRVGETRGREVDLSSDRGAMSDNEHPGR